MQFLGCLNPEAQIGMSKTLKKRRYATLQHCSTAAMHGGGYITRAKYQYFTEVDYLMWRQVID